MRRSKYPIQAMSARASGRVPLESKQSDGRGSPVSAVTQNVIPKCDAAPRGAAIDCVFLSCFSAECHLLACVLHYSGIRLHYAGTLEAADFLLTVTEGGVPIADAVFLDGSWHDALAMLAAAHPRVALLVAAEKPTGRSSRMWPGAALSACSGSRSRSPSCAGGFKRRMRRPTSQLSCATAGFDALPRASSEQ